MRERLMGKSSFPYLTIPLFEVEDLEDLDKTPIVILDTWDMQEDRLRAYTFKAPSRLIAAVDAKAYSQGLTRSELIRKLLYKYVMGEIEVE